MAAGEVDTPHGPEGYPAYLTVRRHLECIIPKRCGLDKITMDLTRFDDMLREHGQPITWRHFTKSGGTSQNPITTSTDQTGYGSAPNLVMVPVTSTLIQTGDVEITLSAKKTDGTDMAGDPAIADHVFIGSARYVVRSFTAVSPMGARVGWKIVAYKG